MSIDDKVTQPTDSLVSHLLGNVTEKTVGNCFFYGGSSWRIFCESKLNQSRHKHLLHITLTCNNNAFNVDQYLPRINLQVLCFSFIRWKKGKLKATNEITLFTYFAQWICEHASLESISITCVNVMCKLKCTASEEVKEKETRKWLTWFQA